MIGRLFKNTILNDILQVYLYLLGGKRIIFMKEGKETQSGNNDFMGINFLKF